MKARWATSAAAILILSSIGLEVNAASPITGGTMTVDTRISAFDSPLVLTEPLIVPSGVNFVVDPGVEIRVNHDDWAFTVFGNLTIGSEFGEAVARGNSEKFLEVPATAVNANVKITSLSAYEIGEIRIDSGANVTVNDSRFSGPHYVFTEWSPASIEVKNNVFFSQARTNSPTVNGRCNSYGLSLNHSLGTVKLIGNSFQGGDEGKSASCSAWVSHAAPEQLSPRFSFDRNSFDTGKTPIAHFRTSANLGSIFVNTGTVGDLINPADAKVPSHVKVTYELLKSKPLATAEFWQPNKGTKLVEMSSQRLFRGSGHVMPFRKLNSVQLDAISKTISQLDFSPKKAHCVGIRTASMSYSQSLEIRKHAKAICGEIAQMGMEVSTWYGSKLSSATSLAGDILLVLRGN